MKLNKAIPAEQMVGLPSDLEGIVQSMRGQETVGKNKKEDQAEESKPETTANNDQDEISEATATTPVEKETSEPERKGPLKFRKSTKLDNRTVEITSKDGDMDIFNKYVDFYAGQPGRGRAVWLEDELVESFSKLKEVDAKYSIRTVICAALRTFIEKNAKELGELKTKRQKPKRKGLF